MLLAIQNIHIIPSSGVLNDIFHKTWLAVSIAGFPANGYKVTLIGLIIIMIIAIAANGVTERLTGKKVGGMLLAVLITILGSWLFQAYVKLPFDFAVEDVAILAALLGAIVIAVFWTLIRGAGGK